MKKYSLLFLFLPLCVLVNGQVKVEYIAHASFILESPEGTRLAIDPYNGKHSLGYYFPDNMAADAVAITHPHFDHDASYYFGPQTPVLKNSGTYSVNDISILGIEAEHAGAPRFRKRGAVPHNTIWVIEIDGIKLVHLGDNGLLDDQMLKKIGNIDVLMIQNFEDHHFYNDEEFDRVVSTLTPSIIIPMHYRLTAISNIPSWTGDVDPWLKQRNGLAHDSNEMVINKGDLSGGDAQIVKLMHSPLVRPWDDEMKTSWEEFVEVRSKLNGGDKDFESLNDKATSFVKRSPQTLIYYNLKAQLLDSLGRYDEMIPLLTNGLADSGLDDWEQQLIAHHRMAKYYNENGFDKLAEEHYRWILGLKRTYQQKIRDEALSYFEEQK